MTVIASPRSGRGNLRKYMRHKQPAVYIVCNKRDGVLYTGVSSNLMQRTFQHKTKAVKGFTARYNCDRLVYYELFDNMVEAIAREKQIKAGSRKKKVQLIEAMNPEWKDLYESIGL